MASIQSDLESAAGPPAQSVVVDGLVPRQIEYPSRIDDVASLVADAAASGERVVPFGGGTKLALGNPPARADLGIGTSQLNRVLHYEPTDLTLSVEAGIRFADLQTVLREKGQSLPIETADDEQATVGGLIATALAGPRRFGSGTLRDLLIGIAVAYPSGIVGKAGGLVVKNVTGFDLMRLHLGALGTLGVIVSANFKVLPHARTEATVLSGLGSREAAFAAARAARSGRVRPVSLEIFAVGEQWRMAARIEGRAETVALGAASIAQSIESSELINGDESAAWWRAYVQAQSLVAQPESVLVRCGGAPKTSAELAEGMADAFAKHDISPEIWQVSPGLGTTLVRFKSSGLDSLAPLQSALFSVAETVTVLAAPTPLKHGIDVWGREPATIATMRALKAEFDSTGTLNPGRFAGRI